MSTAKTPVTPNYSSDNGSVYPANIDQGMAANSIIANQFQPHQSAVGSPEAADMSITIEAGTIFNGVTYISKAQQVTSLSPADFIAPTTNPRVDRVAIDITTGNYVVITGTEGASPAAPAYSPNHYPICQINFATVSPVITQITNDMITDERPLIVKRNVNETTISGAAAATIEVSGLDSTYTGGYIVDGYIITNNTGSVRIELNGDTTDTNYQTYRGTSNNDAILGSLSNTVTHIVYLYIIQDTTQSRTYVNADLARIGVNDLKAHSYYTVTDNLTSIALTMAAANIDVGSYIRARRII